MMPSKTSAITSNAYQISLDESMLSQSLLSVELYRILSSERVEESFHVIHNPLSPMANLDKFL